MTNRGVPQWFAQWLVERRAEEEDVYYDSLVPSERMSVYAFIEKAKGPFLADFFNAEAPLAECRRFEDELRGAIVTAHATGVPWVRNDPPPWDLSRWPALRDQLYLDLDPRAAARWLLSNPTYRHLVPPKWERVVLNAKLEPEERVASEKPSGRARGPKPTTRERVAEEMRRMARDKIGQDELRAMKQEQMRAVFRASRETCQRAREEVLSKHVGISDADK